MMDYEARIETYRRIEIYLYGARDKADKGGDGTMPRQYFALQRGDGCGSSKGVTVGLAQHVMGNSGEIAEILVRLDLPGTPTRAELEALEGAMDRLVAGVGGAADRNGE